MKHVQCALECTCIYVAQHGMQKQQQQEQQNQATAASAAAAAAAATTWCTCMQDSKVEWLRVVVGSGPVRSGDFMASVLHKTLLRRSLENKEKTVT